MLARTMWTAAVALAVLAAGCGAGDEPALQGSPAPASEGVIEVRGGLNDPEDRTIAVTELLPEKVTGKSAGAWLVPSRTR